MRARRGGRFPEAMIRETPTVSRKPKTVAWFGVM
jgi:hypothetical protein